MTTLPPEAQVQKNSTLSNYLSIVNQSDRTNEGFQADHLPPAPPDQLKYADQSTVGTNYQQAFSNTLMPIYGTTTVVDSSHHHTLSQSAVSPTVFRPAESSIMIDELKSVHAKLDRVMALIESVEQNELQTFYELLLYLLCGLFLLFFMDQYGAYRNVFRATERMGPTVPMNSLIKEPVYLR